MRIKKYEIDRVIDLDDMVIGSDAASPLLPTKNYRIGDLIQFIKNEGTLSGLSYEYSDGSDPKITPSVSGMMFTNSIHFKQITNLKINRIAFSKKDYTPALNTFVSNESLLKISSPSRTDYGFYKVNTFSKDPSKSYYELSIELIKTFGHGSLKNEEVFELDLEPLLSAEGLIDINHNNTKSIQGGDSGKSEYYHLSKKQYEAIEKIIGNANPPTYLNPTLVLQGSNRNVEMGETVQMALVSVFTKNDAGDLLETDIERRYASGNWEFMIKDTMYSVTEIELRKKVDFRSRAIYKQGECKENEVGEIDCTGRIPAGQLVSNLVTVSPYYKYFFGDSDTEINLSEDVRSLSISGFDFGGSLSIELRVKKGKTQFFLFIRENREVEKIEDLSIQGIDITKAYSEVPEVFSVEDAGGEIALYKKYKFNLSDGYAEDHIHKIFLKNS